jgi:hypothetical protein
MSTEVDIIERIKADLEGVTGSGYAYDLSGSDQVVVGETFAPHRVPGVYIFPGQVRSGQSAGKTLLTSYDRTFNLQIEGWVAPTTDTPGEALKAALNLGSDVMKALENDRSLNTNVHDVEMSMIGFEGAALQRPGLGAVVVECVITYRETAGA